VKRHLVFIKDIVTKGYSSIMSTNIERYKLARTLRFSRRKAKHFLLKKLGKIFKKRGRILRVKHTYKVRQKL
jgi:hypothetical protein